MEKYVYTIELWLFFFFFLLVEIKLRILANIGLHKDHNWFPL